MASKVDTKDKDKQKNMDDEKITKAGLPKDWTTSGLQISTDIKFCDMNMDMKQYTLQITEGQIVYLKDAAQHIKKAYEQQFQGCWHVVCGVNFGKMLCAHLQKSCRVSDLEIRVIKCLLFVPLFPHVDFIEK